MRSAVFIIIVSIAFSSCVTVGPSDISYGARIDNSKVARFKDNITTRQQVIDILGQPQMVSTKSNGSEEFLYYYIYSGQDGNGNPLVMHQGVKVVLNSNGIVTGSETTIGQLETRK